MLWPMVRRRRFGITSLQWMGAPVTPYGDALMEMGPHTPTDLAAAWDYLRQNARTHAIELGNMRADAAVAGLLVFEQPKITREERACSLDLATLGGWDAFEAVQPAKARKNRRRQRRRLQEAGEVRFQVATEGARARELTLQALALKRRWLKSKKLTSTAFAAEGFDEFFAAVAGSRDRPTGCHVASLELAGKAVAIAVAFVNKGHVAVHVVAYDPDVEACAPGSLLFEDMIRDAFSKGWRCFDLMWPGNAYKAEWAPTETAVTSCAGAVTPLGLVHTAVVPRVRSAMKSAYIAMGPTTRKLTIRMVGQ
jgi:CelD/BcsL family acetyltransferase involved in cellulose biosynthesis